MGEARPKEKCIMSTNRYDEIVERQRVRRVRDIAFACLLAAVSAFAITSLRSASNAQAQQLSKTPTCQVETTC